MRVLNPAVFTSHFFLARTMIWDWQINHYAVVMIAWNFFLAALAVAAAFFLARAILRNWPLWQTLLLALVWLLLAPNTAYVMADVRHLIGYCPIGEYGNVCADNAWMTVFFFSYACVGWLALVLAIRAPRAALLKRAGRLWTELATAVALPLIALGFLLGLVNRWNSWDLLHNPLAIIANAFQYGSELTYLKNWLMVSILLSLLYFSGERIFKLSNWEKI